MMRDTIFAVASGAGRAAIAVIRVSGPQAATAIEALAGTVPPPRTARLRSLRDPRTGVLLDHAIVLWLPGPSSFTGEDGAEFQCHGGRAVVSAVLAALGGSPGCRLAEPGEFTRRALLNDRMDLAAVEGLADLIDAETEAQRRQALRQLDGALGDWVAEQRGRILDALAAAESAIDFTDEGDVVGDFTRELQNGIARLRNAVSEQLSRAKAAERVRDGFVVALAGPPNAGKSTLMNALAQREVAIVSPWAGTTRDALEVQLDLDGQLVRLVDTAGLRDSADPVEQIGVARARDRARSADLVLWLTEANHPLPPDPAFVGQRLWRIGTKIDLGMVHGFAPDHAVAVPDRTGLSGLVAALRDVASADASDGALITRARHRDALIRADQILAGMTRLSAETGFELIAENLRDLARTLDTLVGRIESDQVLDAIFARFCIGK